MKRTIVFLSVIVLMFASPGMQKLSAVHLDDQSRQQITSTAEVLEFAQLSSPDDCCAKSQTGQQSSQDHCSAACAVLIDPASTQFLLSSTVLAAPLIEEMESGNPGLLKRPPRILL